MFGQQDAARKYAPLWAMAFAAGATLLKSTGTTYILKREWQLSWSDVAAAVGGAVVGYGIFRVRHGNRDEGNWYTR